MKTIINLIFAILILSCSSCGGDGNDPKPATDQLIGTWKVESITRDDIDMKSYYEDFEITFTKNSFTTENRPEFSPFYGFGTFNKTSNTIAITQDGDLLSINYTLTATTLELDFNFSGDGYPNAKVKGDWEIVLVKQ